MNPSVALIVLITAVLAILVSDPALLGSDALSTAKVLAAAIGRAHPDLVITATESSDGYTGTLPEQLAELLGFPSVTFAKAITVVAVVLDDDPVYRVGERAR